MDALRHRTDHYIFVLSFLLLLQGQMKPTETPRKLIQHCNLTCWSSAFDMDRLVDLIWQVVAVLSDRDACNVVVSCAIIACNFAAILAGVAKITTPHHNHFMALFQGPPG